MSDTIPTPEQVESALESPWPIVRKLAALTKAACEKVAENPCKWCHGQGGRDTNPYRGPVERIPCDHCGGKGRITWQDACRALGVG